MLWLVSLGITLFMVMLLIITELCCCRYESSRVARQLPEQLSRETIHEVYQLREFLLVIIPAFSAVTTVTLYIEHGVRGAYGNAEFVATITLAILAYLLFRIPDCSDESGFYA